MLNEQNGTTKESNESLLAKLANLKNNLPEANQIKEMLVLNNIGLVHYVCKKLANTIKDSSIIEYDDLVNEGFIALMDSIDQYNVQFKENNTFATYARYCIYSELFTYINTHKSHIVAQKKVNYQLNRSKKVELELMHELQTEVVTIEQLAQEMNIPTKLLMKYKKFEKGNFLPINAEINEYADTGTDFSSIVTDYHSSHVYDEVDDQLDFEAFCKKFDEVINTISAFKAEQKKVLQLLIRGYEREEIAEILNISYKKVQSWYDSAKKSFNFTFLEDLFDQFYEKGIYSESHQRFLKENNISSPARFVSNF